MEKIDILEQNIADINFDLLKVLLKDKTTGKYILWATDNYESNGDAYKPSQEIKPELIIGNHTNVIQPRVSKSQSEQIKRTRDKAEVFTPSWVCNQQNNLVDEAWFGKTNVFNFADGTSWAANETPIEFSKEKKWTDYIDARRLEISCGEAPYLVSRYDTVTGDTISLINRIGLLDRKLRVVSENTTSEEEWYKWVSRAFQATYGYEFQGDNVLLARENLLYTFIEYFEDRFEKKPTLMQTKKIATIISWNIWQMDGLTYAAPYSEAPPLDEQMTLFDIFDLNEEKKKEPVFCKIFDWRANTSLEFKSMRNGG
ncbi:hypothetical protein WCZ35_003047 [Listeria monocytogenes]